ncbi:MAG: restriction endonuclease subunit S [Leadbetterella sp.]|nr:restriction endonuclease subunit S [Leadbetterella sp.]
MESVIKDRRIGWDKVKLEDVLDYEQPTKYIVKSENYNNSFKTPVLTAGKSFILGYTDEEDGIFENLPVIIFDDFTTDIKYVDFPFKVKSSAMKILKVNKGKADLRFLYYKMQTLKIDCEQHKRYWISKFAIHEIELPPLETQKRIAEILDTADALRRNDEELLKKYEDLAQAIFIDMFGDPVKNEKGWEVRKLGEISTKITDGTHITPKYKNEGIIFLSAKNIKKFKLNDDSPKFIGEDEHEELKKRCSVEKGDILLTKSGSLGMAAMNNFNFEFSIFESLALIKYSREKVIGKFLLHFLNTPSTQFQFNKMTKGVGVKHLHLNDIRNVLIVLPPISLQNNFAEIIFSVELQMEKIRENLNKTTIIFNSLIQKAFNGELVN